MISINSWRHDSYVHGKGYSAKAVTAYAKYFLDRYDIPTLIVNIRVANKASCKSAEQAGFTLVETKMYQDFNDDEAELYNFYEMTKE